MQLQYGPQTLQLMKGPRGSIWFSISTGKEPWIPCFLSAVFPQRPREWLWSKHRAFPRGPRQNEEITLCCGWCVWCVVVVKHGCGTAQHRFFRWAVNVSCVCCSVGYRYTEFHLDANTVFSLFTCREIASVLRAWLDQCSEDFREPPDYMCLLKLLDYLKNNMPNSDMESRVQNLLKQFQNQEVEAVGELLFPSLFLSSQTVKCSRDLFAEFHHLLCLSIILWGSPVTFVFFVCLFFKRKPHLYARLQVLWRIKWCYSMSCLCLLILGWLGKSYTSQIFSQSFEIWLLQQSSG